jgi:hypothetical protein
VVIRYADGREARVGDQVDYDGAESIVEEIVEEGHSLMTSGVVKRPGLMMTNNREGRVFEDVDSVCWDAIVLLRRRGNG